MVPGGGPQEVAPGGLSNETVHRKRSGRLREASARELAARLAAAGCPDVQFDRAEVMAKLRHEGEPRK